MAVPIRRDHTDELLIYKTTFYHSLAGLMEYTISTRRKRRLRPSDFLARCTMSLRTLRTGRDVIGIEIDLNAWWLSMDGPEPAIWILYNGERLWEDERERYQYSSPRLGLHSHVAVSCETGSQGMASNEHGGRWVWIALLRWTMLSQSQGNMPLERSNEMEWTQSNSPRR